jgi:hypothetical protein
MNSIGAGLRVDFHMRSYTSTARAQSPFMAFFKRRGIWQNGAAVCRNKRSDISFRSNSAGVLYKCGLAKHTYSDFVANGMSARKPEQFVADDPDLPINPVIEAYKKDVDRTLIREQLSRSVEERLAGLEGMYIFWLEAQRELQRKRSA